MSICFWSATEKSPDTTKCVRFSILSFRLDKFWLSKTVITRYKGYISLRNVFNCEGVNSLKSRAMLVNNSKSTLKKSRDIL